MHLDQYEQDNKTLTADNERLTADNKKLVATIDNYQYLFKGHELNMRSSHEFAAHLTAENAELRQEYQPQTVAGVMKLQGKIISDWLMKQPDVDEVKVAADFCLSDPDAEEHARNLLVEYRKGKKRGREDDEKE